MSPCLRVAFFLFLSTSLLAQTLPNPDAYYIPSSKVALTTAQFKGVELERWYVAAEGLTGGGQTRQSNDLGGLMYAEKTSKSGWGVLAGISYRANWALEVGYAYSPVRYTLGITSSPAPFTFNYHNGGHSIALRVKRRLLTTSREPGVSGFWVSAGAWLLPNAGGSNDAFMLKGYSYHRRTAPDTLLLTSTTQTTPHPTGLAELGLEYDIRLGYSIELGFNVRRYWGLGTALRTTTSYSTNGVETQTATLTANGDGWSTGLVVRYVYASRHGLKRRIRED